MATYKNLRKVLNLPTLSENPSSGVNGEMYFNTGDSALYIYDGAWKKVTQSAIATPDDWTATTQQAKIQASDAQADDLFSYSVDISSDTVVVSAHVEDTGGNAAGAAYVFTRSGTSWSQQAKLQSSDIEAVDIFGHSVAIDGDTIVVGSRNEDAGGSSAGALYVFTRSGTTWSQQAKLLASDAQADDYLGFSVAIDGDTIVAGANKEDTGGTEAGAAYVFTRSGTTWSQQAKLTASDAAADDYFGSAVNISGDTVVVGASNEDAGGSNAGAAYVFTRSGTSWSQQAKLTASDAASNDYFGGTAIGISGDTVAVGARLKPYSGYVYKGAAYIFTRSGTSWSQQAKLTASDAENGDQFGNTIAITGDTVVVGAHEEDTGGSNAGAAYIFTRSGTSWTEAKKIQASDVGAGDEFGNFVAISGNTVLVTAYGEDTGGDNAGAAYTFVAG